MRLLMDRPIAFHPILGHISGSAQAGLFLSQLFYWSDRGADPDGWIYKTQEEWQAETCLSRYEQETARRKLRELGLIEEKRSGLPARLFYRINSDALDELLDAYYLAHPQDPQSRMGKSTKLANEELASKNGENPQTCRAEIPDHSITEITPETTSETTTERESAPDGAPGAGAPPPPPAPSVKPKAKRERPSKPPSERTYTPMAFALTEVCAIDRLAITNKLYGQVTTAARALEKAGYTREQVARLYGRGGIWYRVWPASGSGEAPRPDQVQNTIKELLEREARPVVPTPSKRNGGPPANAVLPSHYVIDPEVEAANAERARRRKEAQSCKA